MTYKTIPNIIYVSEYRTPEYSGDLNNKHMNNGNIWIGDFYKSIIQMPVIQVNGSNETRWMDTR